MKREGWSFIWQRFSKLEAFQVILGFGEIESQVYREYYNCIKNL
jgi:hypothetical protein